MSLGFIGLWLSNQRRRDGHHHHRHGQVSEKKNQWPFSAWRVWTFRRPTNQKGEFSNLIPGRASFICLLG